MSALMSNAVGRSIVIEGKPLSVGIDPGLDGAWVVIRDGQVLLARVLPTIEAAKGGKREIDVSALLELAAETRDLGGRVVVCLEAMGIRPKQSAQSGATTGKNYGKLEMLLASQRWAYDIVQPKQWQKEVCPGTTDSKLRAIAAAQRLLPDLDLHPPTPKTGKPQKPPHEGLADAACMALYAQRRLA